MRCRVKRKYIDIGDIASYTHLAAAFLKAKKGKSHSPAVAAFALHLDRNIEKIRNKLLYETAPIGEYTHFTIHDPKKRIIHAVSFKDRVLHHGVMHFLESIIDKALLPTVYACRKGKGKLKAVLRVQYFCRRYPWYVKIDIRKYFDSIDHGILYNLLRKKIKGREVLGVIWRIINSYQTEPGKGLPIGTLPSQYFANFYLHSVDRFITERTGARGYVRYMDDIIWWCDTRGEAKASLAGVRQFIHNTVHLELKESIQINRSVRGVTFCGFRVLPGTIRLTRRKKKLYKSGLRKWEQAYVSGAIDQYKLQAACDAVHSAAIHAKSREWRKKYLENREIIDV